MFFHFKPEFIGGLVYFFELFVVFVLDGGVRLGLLEVVVDVVEVVEVGGRAEGVDLGEGFGVVGQVEGLGGGFHGEEVRNIIKKVVWVPILACIAVNQFPFIIFFMPRPIMISPRTSIIPSTDNSAIF